VPILAPCPRQHPVNSALDSLAVFWAWDYEEHPANASAKPESNRVPLKPKSLPYFRFLCGNHRLGIPVPHTRCVEAATEEAAKEQAQQVIEWLTAEPHQRGHMERTFFEGTGIEPVSDPPAVNSE